MFLRLILAVVTFWVVLRLLRLAAKYLLNRSEPPQQVHTKRCRGRKSLDSGDAIDVEFRESAGQDEGSTTKRE